MTNRIADISQRQAVTLLRILYPIWIVFGIFSLMYVPSILIVLGDAGATAKNILSNELLFNMGIAGSLITQLIFIFAALFLYKLFEPVNKNHSLLMVIFALVGVPIAMLNTLNKVAALILLKGTGHLTAFEPSQLQSLMMFFLNLNAQGIIIASIFWGLWLFPLGYLIYKSGYFPRIIGIFVIIGGFGYLLGSFAHFLLPNFDALLSVLEVMTFGEVIFVGWLLIKGAKLPAKTDN